MYSLSIDTSCYLQLALYNDNKLVCYYSLAKDQSLISDVVFKYLEQMLEDANIEYHDLQFISVINGPGFFTSLRIAIVIVKILKLAFNFPVFTFNTLDILAQTANSVLTDVAYQYMYVFYNIGSKGGVLGVFDSQLQLINEISYYEIEAINQQLSCTQNNVVISNAKNLLAEFDQNNLLLTKFLIPDINIMHQLAREKFNSGDLGVSTIKINYYKDFEIK